MNVLAIVRSEEELKSVVDYAGKVTAKGDELHLVNIIHVHGDIPTTREGLVLDDCSEFDLSPYLKEKSEHELWMRSAFDSEIPIHRKVVVGDREKILTEYVAKNDIDLIITTTEQTTEALDIIRKTKADRLRRQLNLPVLAFKCDRSKEEIRNIAIVSDFSESDEYMMTIPKHIAQMENSIITLYSFCADPSEFGNTEQRMDNFILKHGLQGAEKVMLEAKNKEKSAQDLLMQYPIQLMVIMDFKRTGLKKLLKGDLESDMLNHTLVPILAL